jgi:hypothetical protein
MVFYGIQDFKELGRSISEIREFRCNYDNLCRNLIQIWNIIDQGINLKIRIEMYREDTKDFTFGTAQTSLAFTIEEPMFIGICLGMNSTSFQVFV